jgi:uncharacterized cupredoxin-like copper-binding protein
LDLSRLRISIAALFAVVAVAAEPTLARSQHKTVLPATTVKVVMTDFHFALSTKVVRRGVVTFKVVNKGATTHDFFVYRINKKTPLIQPGKSAILTVTFRKAGVYHYICTIGEHAFHGMQGDLRVK